MVLDLVLIAHVAGAFVWLGASLLLAIAGIRQRRSRDLGVMRRYARRVSFVGARVVTPVALVVLVSGLWLVLGGDEWTVGQPWVVLGIAALVLAVLVGAAIVGRAATQLEQVVAVSAPDGLAVERALNRLLLGWGLVLALLVLAFVDMGLKPGT